MSVGWNRATLHKHLQAAVDLEFWTIPFYMSAMYSIVEPSDPAYQLTQSVVFQEMLHVQTAANVANAFGLSPTFKEPVYEGKKIPHLKFNLDTPNPTEEFRPYSAEIGPFDIERLNAFCLIEYPEWDTEREPSPRARMEEYGSIGEFYTALTIGCAAVVAQDPENLEGDVKQIDLFRRFYNAYVSPTTTPVFNPIGTSRMCVTEGGDLGLDQVLRLLDVVTSQGEGQTEGNAVIPTAYQNTADDVEPPATHFTKFFGMLQAIQNGQPFPQTYPLKKHPPKSRERREQTAAQERLKKNFAKFRRLLETMFGGGVLPDNFGVEMAMLGGNILRCWQLGVVPTF
jgi:hypothetical protein